MAIVNVKKYESLSREPEQYNINAMSALNKKYNYVIVYYKGSSSYYSMYASNNPVIFELTNNNLYYSYTGGIHFVNQSMGSVMEVTGDRTGALLNDALSSSKDVELRESFTPVGRPPITVLPLDATLTQAVDHMVFLDEEIDEQTTKLATNLQEKGVEVLPTDKMSNLIDKINHLSDIKVKTGTLLPSIVENNSIFIQTTTSASNIYIQDIQPTLANNNIYIKSTSDSSQGATSKFVMGGVNKVTVYVSSCQQMIDDIMTTKNAWVGLDGQWVQFSFEEYIIFSADICNLDSDVPSNWDYYCNSKSSKTSTSLSIQSNPKRIYTTTNSGEYADDDCYWYIKTTLDFTPFKKLYFDLSKIYVKSYGGAGVGVWDMTNNKAIVSKSYGWSSYPSTDKAELDVSDVNGVYTIFIKTGTGSASSGATIEAPKIYLIS